jgi:hypothetical protein
MHTTTIQDAGLKKLLCAITVIAGLQATAIAQTTPALPATPAAQATPASAIPSTSGLLTAAQYDDVATLLIGKTPASGLPDHLSQSQKWATYTQTVETNWAEYTKKIGAPMVEWAKTEVPQVNETVFYPFSGPDFTTAYQMYPNAKRYIMVAMQNAERPLNLGVLNAQLTDQALDILVSAWQLYGTHGFFVTSYLDRYYYATQGRIGSSTFITIFMKLQGFELDRIVPIKINSEGDVEEIPAETRLWPSVRIYATKAGKPIVLDYLKMDLSNPGLQASPENLKFVQAAAVHPTIFKAASHLPQNANFNMIANEILTRAPLVVQDETALNYSALIKSFDVSMYGKFVIAHHAFQSYHTDLAQAFTQRADIKPLNYRFGYYKDGNYVVLVARRK